MAGQQQQIIDTIFSMKRRILRPDDSSDSEETETPYTTQKQNLKRKAQYTRSGDADFLSDPRPYKKRIEHAGHQRYILQRNPPRYDADGDIVEAGDEYEDEDDLSTIEENPYADIHLEHLLAPLTSAADLPTHPSYSLAYISSHLTDMVKEVAAISRKEQVSLSHAKGLFNKLQGDSSFAPHALVPMAQQPLKELWGNDAEEQGANGDFEQAERGHGQDTTKVQDAMPTTEDVAMEDVTQANETLREERNGDSATTPVNGTEPATNGASHDADAEDPQMNGEGPHSPVGDDVSDTASQQTHRMTTRARAQAASTPSPPSSSSSAVNPIHPLFTFSTDSLPDRDFGLPPAEAEETRMLLMAYVQKQEEISRVATDLYHGMLRGERMRQDVFKWAKAEAHLGEMSDGEDWYDREEWNLEEDLIKGKDEEEDDTQVAGKKSTRQRRKPDKEDR